jgi:ribosomal protein L11 methyltransferase
MTPILMEPGQAFGTGLHPTTRLCIRFLERRKFTAQDRCLDVGTGTGILAIVMEKLGARKIQAIDNDPLAVEAAADNVRVNHCHAIEVSGDDIARVKPGCHLIVSNILLKTHEELAAQYARLVPVNGELIVSGLLKDPKEPVEKALKAVGFSLLDSEYMEEWAAFRLRKERA